MALYNFGKPVIAVLVVTGLLLDIIMYKQGHFGVPAFRSEKVMEAYNKSFGLNVPFDVIAAYVRNPSSHQRLAWIPPVGCIAPYTAGRSSMHGSGLHFGACVKQVFQDQRGHLARH